MIEGMLKKEKNSIFQRVMKRLEIRHCQMYFLTKHFLKKILNNSLSGSHFFKAENFFGISIIFGLTGAVIAQLLLYKYLALMMPISRATVWLDNTIFITYMMSIMAIICAVAWDNLFLDKEDYSNLITLPIKFKTLFVAKFLSTLLLISFVSMTFNFSSTFLFSTYLSDGLQIDIFYFAFAYFITNLLAIFFIFFAISAIHGILTVLFTNRLMKNVSIYFRILFIIVSIAIFFFFPQKVELFTELKETSSPMAYFIPPFWFTGLLETLLGTNDVFFKSLMPISIISIIAVLGIYFIINCLSLRKYLSRMNISRSYFKFSKILDNLRKIFNRVFLRNPVERGTFYFAINIFKRKLNLKLQMGLFMTIPTTLMGFKIFFYYSKNGLSYFETVNASLISISLVFIFFLVGGTRILILNPVMLKASWVIELTENQIKTHYVSGIKKALFFFAIFPFFILMSVFFALIWNFKLAIYHIGFCTAISILLMELFFVNYRKMPFVIFSIPDRTKLKYLIGIYIMGFFIHFAEFTFAGLFLLENPGYYIIFYPLVFIFYGLFKWYQYKKNREYQFEFHEETDPYFLSLALDKVEVSPVSQKVGI